LESPVLFKLTLMPQNTEVWLAANEPLTSIEYEPGGGQAIPFGCRAGACGVCVIEILDGKSSLGAKGLQEAEFLEALGFAGEQFRLACQCRLLGEAVIQAAAC
jgi:ferredoxin